MTVVKSAAKLFLTMALLTGGLFATAPCGEQGISYHGGPVMTTNPNIHYLFYGGWDPTNVPADAARIELIKDFTRNISSATHFTWLFTNTLSGYCDGAGNMAAPVIYLGSSAYLSGGTTFPTLAGMKSAIESAITAGTLPYSTNDIYTVMLHPDTSLTAVATGICGEHTSWTFNNPANNVPGTLKFVIVGAPDNAYATGCMYQNAYEGISMGQATSGDVASTRTISYLLHEIAETIPDPEPANPGWDEISDPCGTHVGTYWTGSSAYGTPSGAYANLWLPSQTSGRSAGREYLVQELWKNASGGYCGQ